MRTIVPTLLLTAALAACQAGTGEPANADPAADAASRTASPAAASASPTVDETPAEPSKPAADECGADKLGRWLNVLPSETVKAEIADVVGHTRIRFIAPDDMVTMDLRPDRLNVETGEDGRIKLFRCG